MANVECVSVPPQTFEENASAKFSSKLAQFASLLEFQLLSLPSLVVLAHGSETLPSLDQAANIGIKVRSYIRNFVKRNDKRDALNSQIYWNFEDFAKII